MSIKRCISYSLGHLTQLLNRVDHLIERSIVLRVNDEDEEKYFIAQKKIREKSITEIRHEFLDVIDGKSASMITHISILVGILFYFLNSTDNIFVEFIIFIEITIYVCILILLLRCVHIIGPQQNIESPDDAKRKLFEVVRFRREVYRFCVEVTVPLTAAIIPTTLLTILF